MSGIPNARAHLAQIPLFSHLTPEELDQVDDLFREEVYLRGDTVCTFGDTGDIFYVIIEGELEVLAGGDKLVAVLGPDEFFGELAVMLGDKRSATILATQRSVLLALDKEPFNRFLLGNPKALEYMSRVICQRLATTNSAPTVRQACQVVSVIGRPGLLGKSLVANSLAELLRRFSGKDVLLVRAGVGADRPGVDVETLDDDLATVRRGLVASDGRPTVLDVRIGETADPAQFGRYFSSMVAKIGQDFPYVVMDLGSHPAELLDSVARYSESVVELVAHAGPVECAGVDGLTDPIRAAAAVRRDADDHEMHRVHKVVNLFNRESRPLPINSCEPYVLRKDPALTGPDLDAAVRRICDQRDTPTAIPLHRLARKILGRTVGIALGGGAAFGIAHLGVLKVLEDNGIPIDMIVGCSIGSLVGVGYANGLRAPRLIQLAGELGTKSRLLGVADFTLTRPGFLAGDRIRQVFMPFLDKSRTFNDLQTPYRAVATDIESGERVAIGTGKLDDAFRASCSVPVVLSPIKPGKRCLVDGGVCDPVPAEVVRAMGADICIAVNVVPPLKKGVEMFLSRAYRQMNAFNPLAYLGGSVGMPNMLDIVMNSLQILQHELGDFKAISADVRINPDLADFTWIEFYRDKELVQRGIDAATLQLPAIRRALAGAA